jgi:uracil-DNA glycosylase
MFWSWAQSRRLIRVFDSLIAELRQCNHCKGLPLGPKPIFQMSETARILIVGQAPGRLTHAKGLPFDDASGNRLRSWIGIDRALFYDAAKIACLPMGFCYPGTGKGGDLPPRPECAPLWRSRLLPFLARLRLVLVLGQYAHAHYFPSDRGTLTERVRAWGGEAVVPLPHPSPRNGVWLKANPWFEAEVLPRLRDAVASALRVD